MFPSLSSGLVLLSVLKMCSSDRWANVPSLEIYIRLYAGSVSEYWNLYALGHNLFWPRDWKKSRLVLIFDSESERDAMAAAVVESLPPYPVVQFEDPPAGGHLCTSPFRSHGYTRQIYSSFWADNHTSADYVGIADTDSWFCTHIRPGDFFNSNGKPHILGYNGCCTPWAAATRALLGVNVVFEFMTLHGFPIVIKRSHLADLREHIRTTTKSATFLDAFKSMCAKGGEYSQQSVIGNYLWHFKRDEYEWHLLDQSIYQHPGINNGRASSEPDVLAANISRISLMKHGGHDNHREIFPVISEYLCVSGNWSSQACRKFFSEKVTEDINKNLFRDWTFWTHGWKRRNMPIKMVSRDPDEGVLTGGLPHDWRKVIQLRSIDH